MSHDNLYLSFLSFLSLGLLLRLTDACDVGGRTQVQDPNPVPRPSNGLSGEISLKILKKEVISRRVLVDEGSRKVVEVEQAAMWKFLWWSGIIVVHVMVDKNRYDRSVSESYCPMHKIFV
ncbi:hypothetical protein MKW92_005600 [Papaver armeniacum]|nr:hypothetical protein MKW92_005600 [Papaver armeniacum]